MKSTFRLFHPCLVVFSLFVCTLFIGCAPSTPTGLVASDGTYSAKIVVTWNAERVSEGGNPRTDHYTVFRADGADGPYTAISGNITETVFEDASVTPDQYYYYQVVAYSKLGQASKPSAYDAGYAGNTNALFLQKCLDTEASAIAKLDAINPSTDVGTQVSTSGDIGGTCQKAITNYFIFWKKTVYTYTSYQDTVTKGIVLNGTLTDITGIGSEGLGTVTGTITITGDHAGYVEYDLKVTALQRSGGGYWVSQNDRPEEWFAWYPNVPSDTKPTADIPDQETAQALLYTAFSGIAYDKGTDLYGLMLEDNMNLLESLAIDIVIGDEQLLNKAIGMLAGKTTKFSITTASGTFSFTIDPAGAGTKSNFSGEVALDFNDVGYSVGSVTYYGTSEGPELTGALTGYYSIDLNTYDIVILFSTIEFELGEGLKASYTYPHVFEVNYHQFKIAFDVNYGPNDPINPQTIPLNVNIVPQVGTLPEIPAIDNRDYTFGGSFTTTIGGVETAYTFGKDFHYTQNQTDDGRNVTIKGLLGLTGLDGLVMIETGSDIALGPLGQWIAGSLIMNGATSSDTASFANDGSAQFTGHLGDWLVANWQNVLSPL